jgi:folate-dependent phosphoribosylglycinamide formyltransferase PurN
MTWPSAAADSRAMRIVFLAVNDEFAGSMQKYVYETHPEWVVGSVISKCAIYKKSKMGGVLFLLRRSGIVYTAEMIRMKIVHKALRRNAIATPAKLAEVHHVETFYSSNINDDQSLARLAAWSPDLIISTNFSHYIGERARRTSRVGTWNLHKSLLPRYRGMAPSFYALLNDEKKIGATLHKVAKGFDTGDILSQIEVPVTASDSVHSLNRNASDSGGRMLAAYLERLDFSAIQATPQPPGDWPSYSYPSKADIKAFRRKGCRF